MSNINAKKYRVSYVKTLQKLNYSLHSAKNNLSHFDMKKRLLKSFSLVSKMTNISIYGIKL